MRVPPLAINLRPVSFECGAHVRASTRVRALVVLLVKGYVTCSPIRSAADGILDRTRIRAYRLHLNEE